jgi:hypothetical protein
LRDLTVEELQEAKDFLANLVENSVFPEARAAFDEIQGAFSVAVENAVSHFHDSLDSKVGAVTDKFHKKLYSLKDGPRNYETKDNINLLKKMKNQLNNQVVDVGVDFQASIKEVVDLYNENLDAQKEAFTASLVDYEIEYNEVCESLRVEFFATIDEYDDEFHLALDQCYEEFKLYLYLTRDNLEDKLDLI